MIKFVLKMENTPNKKGKWEIVWQYENGKTFIEEFKSESERWKAFQRNEDFNLEYDEESEEYI